jgi:hypothetical protein
MNITIKRRLIIPYTPKISRKKSQFGVNFMFSFAFRCCSQGYPEGKGIMVGRRYRNRRVGEFFKELKMTEGRCTGGVE